MDRLHRRTKSASLPVAAVFLAGLFSVSARPAQTPAASAPDAAPDLKSFVGTWKASLHGEVFAILTIREERGGLAGTLNNFDLSVDKDGSLAEGTHKDDGDAPLLNAHFKSGALIFTVMQKDQYAPSSEWKFIPRSAHEGDLAPLIDYQISGPKDVAVKPIAMVRELPARR